MILENKLTRIFVAFPVPDEIATLFSTYINRFQDLIGVRWTKPGNLHLTLFFIGEVEPANIVHVIEALQPIEKNRKSFTLLFEKITFRGKVHQPGMIWAQFEKSEEFSRISSQLHEVSKRFMTIVPQHLDPIPHITLARLKKGAEISKIREEEFSFPQNLLIDKMELWKTVQTSEGVLYEKIA